MDNLRRAVCAGILVAAVTILAAACGGSSGSATPSVAPPLTATAAIDPPASPALTAAPTATQHPIEPCPEQSVCYLGHSLAAALKSGDATLILDHWPAQAATSPGDVPQLGGPFPLCDGAAAGEVRSGYTLLGSTEGSVLSKAQVGTLFGTPPYSGSPWALRTVGCPPSTGATPCSDGAIIVLSTQSVGPDLLVGLSLDAGSWTINFVRRGPLFQEDLDSVLVNGGIVGGSGGGPMPAGTRFYRVN
ncbi:MAG TPA: hypothetical protein VNL71_22230 [Chloroflexota bacterium]|nr:hypothetical protein [Chloroflexota bacterium]